MMKYIKIIIPNIPIDWEAIHYGQYGDGFGFGISYGNLWDGDGQIDEIICFGGNGFGEDLLSNADKDNIFNN